MSTLPPVKKKRKRIKHDPSFYVERSNTNYYVVTEFGKDGWADAEKYKPIPYDLITLFTHKGKKKSGWWAEFFWEGYRLMPDDKIVKWRKKSLCGWM